MLMYRNISRDISDVFESRIISFLYYGSHAFSGKTRSRFSDYDFCLVLDKHIPTDLSELKKITGRYKGIDLTVHYLNDLEEIGWNSFQHGNHGTFFLLHLAASKTLLGINIFERKIAVLDKADIKDSLRRQIIEYFWRLDHWYLSETENQKLNLRYKKYLIRIAQDIMVSRGDISFSEINRLSDMEFINSHLGDKNYFSTKTKKQFHKISTSEPSLIRYIQLRESLYRDFRKIFI